MTAPEDDPEGRAEGAEPSAAAGAWAAFEDRLERAARGSLATVLLTGASGSGKSRAARVVHDASERRDGPFVVVHLAGLATTLLEAELFGHAEGAFTGAHKAREGRFQRAEGGTIVLEAIETLERPLQVKLLRVLQERVVEPLGTSEAVPIDVRVIATTARDLTALVAEGEFREDLYFRLAVVPITVPPLRSRRDDPELPEVFRGTMAAVAERIGAPARPLTDAALARLAAHPWPGNFRELENAFERVLVLGDSGVPVEASELEFLAEATRGRAAEIAADVLAAGVGLEELDAEVLRAALEQERGNLSAAARALGLSRRAFDYRRKKLSSKDDEASGD